MYAGVSGGWGVSEQGGGLRKGPWTAEEDRSLHDYVSLHGEGQWSTVARSTGLNRSAKSCRLRWVNYLKPGLKKGQLTPQEQSIIIELHSFWGNKWSMIARCLPGRTDNEIKNYWRTHFKNKEKFPGSGKKVRTRAPRREKLLQQQLQQQQEQDQQQQELVENYKKFQIGHQVEADKGDYKVRFGEDINVQEIMSMCSNNFEDDQCLSEMFDYQDGGSSIPDDDSFGGSDEGIWGELWNLDDVNVHQAHFNIPSGSSNNEKVTMQNQVPSSSCSFYGGDQFKLFDVKTKQQAGTCNPELAS